MLIEFYLSKSAYLKEKNYDFTKWYRYRY